MRQVQELILDNQGAETLCVCVCAKGVCVKFNEPKVCTVGIYGTYICVLLIVYLKISLIYM